MHKNLGVHFTSLPPNAVIFNPFGWFFYAIVTGNDFFGSKTGEMPQPARYIGKYPEIRGAAENSFRRSDAYLCSADPVLKRAGCL